MVDIKGLVPGQDPKTPVGELRIELNVDRALLLEITDAELQAIGAYYNTPVRLLLGKTAEPMTPTRAIDEQEWQKELDRLQAETDENIACRNAWLAGDRSVPFPNYWAGWQAATTGSLAVANLAGQLNATLQPTPEAEAFKKLRVDLEAALALSVQKERTIEKLRELVPAHVEKAFDRASQRRTALENALYAFGFSVTWGADDKLTVEREESDEAADSRTIEDLRKENKRLRNYAESVARGNQ